MIELYNKDCLDLMEDLIAKGVRVDSVICDPPYLMDNHGGGKSALADRATKAQRDEISKIVDGFDYDRAFDLMLKICKVPNLIIFCSNDQVSQIMSYFESRNLKSTLLVWDKLNPSPLCNGKYVSDLEYIVYVHTKGSPWNNEAPYKDKLKCKQYSIMTGKDKIHPTQKPVDLLKELVELHSFEGDTILDCFMGSGSTGIACYDLKRNFIGVEMDKDYFKKTTKRFQDYLPMFNQKELKVND